MFERLKSWFAEQVAAGIEEGNKDYTKIWVKQARKITKGEMSKTFAAAKMEDVNNLSTAFPPDIEVPQLVYDFCHMLTVTPLGSLGWLELTIDDKVEILLPPDANMNNDFAMFLLMPDGSLSGLWFKDDRNPETAPFVLMNSEGCMEKIAPNFLAFLDRLTRLDFEPDNYCDYLPIAVLQELDDDDEGWEDEAPIDMSEFFRDWLEGHPDVDHAVLKSAPASYKDYDDGKAQKWINRLFKTLDH